MRILVIGGRGFYGARVVEVLRRLAGVHVTPGGRHEIEGHIDLLDPATFPVMDTFDLVVNCSDTVRAPPDPAVAYALLNEVVFFEMGADSPTVERLLNLPTVGARGTVVVGVGLFPGVSTSLAHSVAKTGSPAKTIDVFVRFSPLSGAGVGNCALMVDALSQPSYRFERGERREGPIVGTEVRASFSGTRGAAAAAVAMPDVALVRRGTGVPDVATYLALAPGLLRHSFRLLAAALRASGPLRPVGRRLVAWSLWLSRGLLLRNVPTPVQITAVADRGLPTERTWRLAVDDGQQATALAVAAAVESWRDRGPPPPGLYTAGQVFDGEALVRRMAVLGVDEVDLSAEGPGTPPMGRPS